MVEITLDVIKRTVIIEERQLIAAVKRPIADCPAIPRQGDRFKFAAVSEGLGTDHGRFDYVIVVIKEALMEVTVLFNNAP